MPADTIPDERLREMLVAALHEPKPRRKTKPSKAAKRRRLESKKRRSDIKSNRRAGALVTRSVAPRG